MAEITPQQQKELEEKIKNMSPEELAEFQKQQCIFCQIISGKIPSQKLFEDEQSLVILDINPAVKGHLLVLPKEHYSIMPQMPQDVTKHLFGVSKKMSQILLKGLRVDGTNLFIANGLAAGQRAQHFMIHLIPRKEGDGLFNVDEKSMEKKDAIKIKNRLNQLLGVKQEVVDTKEDLELKAIANSEKEGPRKKSKNSPAGTESLESEEEDDLEVEDSPELEAGEHEVKGSEEDFDDDQSEKEDVSLDEIADLFK